ncbi:MAG: hypothetical protein GF364_15990 [Candidatus Lokiarchaeota archaeon]|nr:hypothetical protein [Candidatus Lokiarchaeota archaeon]
MSKIRLSKLSKKLRSSSQIIIWLLILEIILSIGSMVSISTDRFGSQSIKDQSIEASESVYVNLFSAQTFTGSMKITAMASPDSCFEIVEQLLLDADTSIYVSVYTLSSPYLMEALIDRIENGIDVKLLLEKEQVNYHEKNYNRWTLKNLTEISHNGNYAQGKWANSSTREEHPEDDTLFQYQHSKYAIIDDDTLILSSGNWGRSSCPKPQDDGDVDGNRDWWVALDGTTSTQAQQVVDYFDDVFAYDWSEGFAYDESVDGAGYGQSYDRSGSSYIPTTAQTFTESMSITPILSPDTSFTQTRSLIQSATSSLQIETMYLKDGLDEIVNDIIDRHNAGVDVEVILSDSSSDDTAVNQLLDAGIEVKRSKPNMDAPNPNPFDTMHNKGIIVDGDTILVSSINWSPASVFNNRESGLIIESSSVAEYYGDLFTYDWGGSEWWDPDYNPNGDPSSFKIWYLLIPIGVIAAVIVYKEFA